MLRRGDEKGRGASTAGLVLLHPPNMDVLALPSPDKILQLRTKLILLLVSLDGAALYGVTCSCMIFTGG